MPIRVTYRKRPRGHRFVNKPGASGTCIEAARVARRDVGVRRSPTKGSGGVGCHGNPLPCRRDGGFEPDQRTGKPGAVGIVGNELAEPGLISDPEDTVRVALDGAGCLTAGSLAIVLGPGWAQCPGSPAQALNALGQGGVEQFVQLRLRCAGEDLPLAFRDPVDREVRPALRHLLPAQMGVDNPSAMRGRAVQVACDLPVFEPLLQPTRMALRTRAL